MSRMHELGVRNADTAMDRLFLPGGHPDNSPQSQIPVTKKSAITYKPEICKTDQC